MSIGVRIPRALMATIARAAKEAGKTKTAQQALRDQPSVLFAPSAFSLLYFIQELGLLDRSPAVAIAVREAQHLHRPG